MLKKLEALIKNIMIRKNLGYFRMTITRDAREGADDWNMGYEAKQKKAIYDNKSGKMKIAEVQVPIQKIYIKIK